MSEAPRTSASRDRRERPDRFGRTFGAATAAATSDAERGQAPRRQGAGRTASARLQELPRGSATSRCSTPPSSLWANTLHTVQAQRRNQPVQHAYVGWHIYQDLTLGTQLACLSTGAVCSLHVRVGVHDAIAGLLSRLCEAA